MTHALIIGKFYPPHAGHHAMVRFAATLAERVTVVVMSASVESVSLQNRVAWMTESHACDESVTITGIVCDAPIDHTSRAVWAAQVACMRAAVGNEPVDVVVTSEPYGEELARWFDARHVPFDLPRTGFPVSGTSCRADLAASWRCLDAPARAGLTTRIVVVGSESTGTTTVAGALTTHFRQRWPDTECVDEFGRKDTVDKCAEVGSVDDIVWTGDDFARIARTQAAHEEAAARRGSPVLICDTDAFATTVWERRYLGVDSHRAVADDRHALYLVTDHHGVPFVQDGIRDGEHVRAEMTGWFLDALTRSRRSWVLLTGSHEERLELGTRAAEQELRRRTTFAAPLGGILEA
ncbi:MULTISPECIES: AAA family ATPase [unclassified Rhodococcus (in: high G+C Gram-positive bacteria)]|uniref:AAA family ATPase n=1 Tax=unclassified Rhodococcus (in: high G+C Gram-positive bacteria) TaxID=192944 RepID=UPI000ADA03E6|nr:MULTISPECIES: AAA family ATPase [unclassified Rhodococcus (in: high G+C Gram-positive bacteria)]